MEDNFVIDDTIEQIIKIIDKDKSVIKELAINELELLDKYLKQKKKYLTEKIGEE